ncbi:kunitz-type U19-barytoxin-Tl1a [Thalassophryne amazonica]|uniref:kunitz-type U19-barytoxin-Tl1a n=1 Tax=Thalassophryne amazonica TaxID=390379 RepID=UPI001471E6B8|nr:kunitz-type U19-barytoxin-Tl1a [Thalassophryne amazonica]
MKHLLFFGILLAALHTSQSIPDFCHLPSDEGEGTSFIYSLFYNGSKDACYPFLYKGQGGNGNRFQNEKACIRNCSVNAENIYPMDERKACLLPKAIGECGFNLLSYYYNSRYDKCKKFLWSGCLGNGNRFPTQEICNATCAGIHADGDEEEEDDSDTPVAIIVGVGLAVIVTAIIISVTVLVVQSKKNGSKKKPKTGGKSREQQVDTPLQTTEMP